MFLSLMFTLPTKRTSQIKIENYAAYKDEKKMKTVQIWDEEKWVIFSTKTKLFIFNIQTVNVGGITISYFILLYWSADHYNGFTHSIASETFQHSLWNIQV